MAGQMRWSAPPIVERAPPPETARVGSRCQHEGARLRLGPWYLSALHPLAAWLGRQGGRIQGPRLRLGLGWASDR